MTPNSPAAVRVTWVDSVHVRGEVADHEIGDTFPAEKIGLLDSVGWLVRDDAEAVVIAQEWNAAQRDWRFLIRIPRSAVRRVRKLS